VTITFVFEALEGCFRQLSLRNFNHGSHGLHGWKLGVAVYYSIGKIVPPYIRSGGEGFGRVFELAADYCAKVFLNADWGVLLQGPLQSVGLDSKIRGMNSLNRLVSIFVVVVVGSSCLGQTTRHSNNPDTTVPTTRPNYPRFEVMHEAFLKRASEGNIDLLFLGDSITQYWSNAPDVWEKHYGKYNAANFGISGDHTENVLWRVDHGELDNIHPKVLVLLIGTNNTGTNSVDEIIAGNRNLIAVIREKLPKTKILLLGIFPRGQYTPANANGKPLEKPETARKKMKMIGAANADMAMLDNGDTIRYLDLSDKFLVDGKIPSDVMPDQLHPSVKGYEIWADGMQPLLDEMMK
jgi:lysophospholipase L1-like esterase